MLVILNATLSGIFAGIVAIGVTVLIERFGGVIGGVLGSSPTTIIPASIGFALSTKNRADLLDAMFTIPIGMLVNSGFLYIWKKVPPYLSPKFGKKTKLLMMIIISLIGWALSVGAVTVIEVIIRYRVRNSMVVLGSIAFFFQLIFGIVIALLRPVPAPKGSNKVGIITLISRGSLASIAIFISVNLSSTNGIAAGFATTFPAIFLTTMASVYWSQGEAVTIGATGPMILGGLSVSVYSIMFVMLEPILKTPSSAFVSYLVAISTCSLPVVYLLKCRQQATGLVQYELQHDMMNDETEEMEEHLENEEINSTQQNISNDKDREEE